MDIERDGNLIEAAFWFVLGFVGFFYSWRREPILRPALRLLSIVLVIFGASDLVESRTGAWWEPWWLFIWKALCVLAMLGCFVRYYRLTKRSEEKRAGED